MHTTACRILIVSYTYATGIITLTTGSPLLASVGTLNITVTDINDNGPVFVNAPYSASLPEGVMQTTRQVLVVTATDADSGTNGIVAYSIVGGESGRFRIHAATVC